MPSPIHYRTLVTALAGLALSAPTPSTAATPEEPEPSPPVASEVASAEGRAAAEPSEDDREAQQSAREDEQVRAHLKLGQKAFAAGRFAEAEMWFDKAFSARPGFDVAANLGAAEQAQGKHHEAAAHYAFALRTFPVTADPEKKRALEERFAESRAKVGTVRLSVDVAGAEILVAGAPLGKSPLADPLFVDPGEVRVEAELGGRRAERTIHIGAGEEQSVSLDLGPGRAVGEQGDGDGGAGPAVAGVGFGLAGAGIVVAVVLTIVADAKTSDANDLRAEYESTGTRCDGGCPELRDAFASADDAWNAATGVWIASGIVAVGAVAATAALFAASSADEASVVAIGPIAAPGLGGLSVRARF